MTDVGTVSLIQRISDVRAGLDEAAVRSGRDPESITVVAVSKTVTREDVDIGYRHGLRHFGENRVMDARAKFQDNVPADLVLHLIGQLQTNKVNHAIALFPVIESVDRSSLIAELGKQATRRDLWPTVLLQVNIAGEAQKSGCDDTDALSLVQEIRATGALHIEGLMTIAPLVDDPEDVRYVFRGLRELRDRLQHDLGIPLPTLSMGMTNDYPVAIQEGATHIRVGRAIFG